MARKQTNQEMEHRVILRIKKECDDKLMTDKQMEKWIMSHFEGCDYGTVRVSAVDTFPVIPVVTPESR